MKILHATLFVFLTLVNVSLSGESIDLGPYFKEQEL